MSVLAGAAGQAEPAGSGFELGFIDGGVERRAPLAACAEVRFQDVMPVRQFRLSGGLGAFPGWRCAGRAEVTRRLREAFAGSAPLLAGAAQAGDPLATLPALFHLMWRQELMADVTRERLGPATQVRTDCSHA